MLKFLRRTDRHNRLEFNFQPTWYLSPTTAVRKGRFQVWSRLCSCTARNTSNPSTSWQHRAEKAWQVAQSPSSSSSAPSPPPPLSLVSPVSTLIHKVLTTVCSGKLVFFREFYQCFATSPSPALGYYWLYRKIANQ